MKTKNETTNNSKPMAYDTLLATVLPCPFCGEKPQFEKGYVPPYIGFMCINDDCHVQPSLEVRVSCKRNDGETETYSPQFELHYEELLNKWNSRP